MISSAGEKITIQGSDQITSQRKFTSSHYPSLYLSHAVRSRGAGSLLCLCHVAMVAVVPEESEAREAKKPRMMVFRNGLDLYSHKAFISKQIAGFGAEQTDFFCICFVKLHRANK